VEPDVSMESGKPMNRRMDVPLTYLAVAVLEATIVIAASIGPALRASRVDPLVALRSE
jgi:ABC-type lipoprotein release transport system permease subunit